MSTPSEEDMPTHGRRDAGRDPSLSARIIDRVEMRYAEGPSDTEDRPPHVRAASGLTTFREYFAVVQDDANWLALVDRDDVVHSVPLPAAPDGSRVFSASRENKADKLDLEACVPLPGSRGQELIGFGSGSHRGRGWILRVHEGPAEREDVERASGPSGALELTAEFLDARSFYDSLRDTAELAGAGLNIEGAVVIDEDTIRLFQRGNAPSSDGLEPVDASGDISWEALSAHLADPSRVDPPAVRNIRRYDLGQLAGVRLTFSDAEHLGEGRVLFSASAEDPDSGEIVGSALGVIDASGRACWTEVVDLDGSRFGGKIEGLSVHLGEPRLARFVIDEDDETLPSVLYTAELSPAFLGRR
jgi:hypothetical protein